MKKLVTAALTIALVVATAGPAAAKTPVETLHTSKRTTAVIKPRPPAAPSGALVYGRYVSVKKGRKLLATNRPAVRVRRGTYSALSVVLYQPRITRTITTDETVRAARVTGINVLWDRTVFNDGGGFMTDWLSGQVTFEYTADCATDPVKLGIGASGQGTFPCSWQHDESVAVDFPPGSDRAGVLVSAAYTRLGDLVSYPEVAPVPVTKTESVYGPLTYRSKLRKVKVVR